MNFQDYTTLTALSQRRGINYHTLRKRLLKSKVKCHRVGNQIFIKKIDVKKIKMGDQA